MLELFQDIEYASKKILYSSYQIGICTFVEIACLQKVFHLMMPINSSNTKIYILYKLVALLKYFYLLLI